MKPQALAIIACGDRNWEDRLLLDKTLHELDPEIVIEGNAKGADILAGLWAEREDKIHLVVPARWGLYGGGAGHIRNSQMLIMLKNQTGVQLAVIAFHNDIENSAGTADMLTQAEDSDIDYVLVSST